MTKEETIQMLESIEKRCRDFPYMTAQDWVTIAAAKRHLNEDIYNERTKESINSAANESLDGLLLAFNLACGNGDKTLGECLEEFKPKIIDAAKKINASASDDLEDEITDYINNHFSECEDGVLLSDAHGSELQYTDVADIARHFVEWQAEQFEKERLKHCDALTEEQAQIESDFVTQHLKENNRTPTFIDAI